MDIDKLLEKIGSLLTSNTALLRKEIKDSEERVKTELKETILKSQQDTIESLTDFMNEGFNNHEERIQKIEKEPHITHHNQQ